MSRARTIAALLLLLAVPRLARIAYPQVWIEDESYLNGAFLLARGFLPYRDFPLPHLPLLEMLLASIFQIAPIAIGTAEIFTQTAAFGASVLVFFAGRRLGDTLTGASAALVFATSGLLFRYHLFEREVFVVVPVLAAFLIALPREHERDSTRRAVVVGVLMFAALAVKLTAIAALVALALQLHLAGRRRFALATVVTTMGLLALAMIVLAARFRTDFIVQVFVFRAVHAAFPSLGVKVDELRYSMDVSFAFGVAGAALILLRRDFRAWAGPLLQLASGAIVLVFLNPTYWAHTGIELLPWLSLAAGYLVSAFLRSMAPRRGRRSSARPPSRALTFACAGAAVLLLLFVSPIRNLNWEAGDGSVDGFGYRDRRELETLGEFVRAHASSDELVATPPIIAFIANRREVVPYAEIGGEIQELTAIVARDGYAAALSNESLRRRSFWESVEASRDRTTPLLEEALSAQRVAVLVNDSADDLMPILITNVPAESLQRDGYQLATVTPHYEAWIKGEGTTRKEQGAR